MEYRHMQNSVLPGNNTMYAYCVLCSYPPTHYPLSGILF